MRLPAVSVRGEPASAVADASAANFAARGPRGKPRRWAAIVILLLFGTALVWSWQRWRRDHELLAARESLRQYQPQQAIEHVRAVIERSPDCAEAEYLWAVACRRSAQLDEVREHLSRAAELGWDARQVDRQRCLTHFQAGDFRSSGTEMIELMLEGASDDEADETYEAMVRGYMTAMMLKQANFILDGWIQWRPRNVRARLMRAEVAHIMGSTTSEIAAYREILRFEPGHVEARRRLARELMLRHEGDEAFALYSALHRERPNDADVLVDLAEWHHRYGQLDKAKKLVATLLELEPPGPTRAKALGLLGQMALANKDFAEAASALGKAVEADAANITNLYALARALSSLGRDREANVLLKRCTRMRELDEELENLREAILDHPEDPELRARIGETLIEKGDRRSGVNWLLGVLFYNPSHARTNRLLAEHYEQAGDMRLAKAHRAIAEGKIKYVAPPAPLGAVSPSSASASREGPLRTDRVEEP